MIRLMAKASSGMLTETSTKASGLMIERMGMGSMCMLTELFTKANGCKTSRKVLEERRGQMEHSTKATTLTARSTVKESYDLLTDLCIRASL
jgi:hypothetical protein